MRSTVPSRRAAPVMHTIRIQVYCINTCTIFHLAYIGVCIRFVDIWILDMTPQYTKISSKRTDKKIPFSRPLFYTILEGKKILNTTATQLCQPLNLCLRGLDFINIKKKFSALSLVNISTKVGLPATIHQACYIIRCHRFHAPLHIRCRYFVISRVRRLFRLNFCHSSVTFSCHHNNSLRRITLAACPVLQTKY